MNLQVFCGEDIGHSRFAKSWVQSGWRYSGDGKIGAREPTDEPDTETPTLAWPDYPGLFTTFDTITDWKPFPALDGKRITTVCRNEVHRPVCAICDGSGICVCPNCDDEHDCTDCRGDGTLKLDISDCPDCAGSNKTIVPAPQRIAERNIAGKYCVMILGLPEPMYSPNDPAKALPFKAGNLQGYVAPIKERS